MKGGENRSTQNPPLAFCSKESRWRAPAAAGELADQVRESAALLATGASALHALEASYTFQAWTPTKPCTLDVSVLGIFYFVLCLEVSGHTLKMTKPIQRCSSKPAELVTRERARGGEKAEKRAINEGAGRMRGEREREKRRVREKERPTEGQEEGRGEMTGKKARERG